MKAISLLALTGLLLFVLPRTLEAQYRYFEFKIEVIRSFLRGPANHIETDRLAPGFYSVFLQQGSKSLVRALIIE